MRIIFVNIENGITAIGFRKVAAFARLVHPQTEVCYVAPSNRYSPINFIRSDKTNYDLSDQDLDKVACYLAKANMVCFSSMTPFAYLTEKIIVKIRSRNPNVYIVWGGIHPIVNPDKAILYANAICIGEGELAFSEFLSAYKKGGDDYLKTRNFWFNTNNSLIKNEFRPLLTPKEMETLPHNLYAQNELIFVEGQGFMPIDQSVYIRFIGLAYHTIWSVGCPFRCVYCSNSKFIENDKTYSKLRFPSVDYIINEIKHAIKKQPYISVVIFHDDSFIAIDLKTLTEFSDKWRKEIKIPFCVQGLNPNLVRHDKMDLLVRGGMNRVRMGIQSGSDRILNFYRRPHNNEITLKSASIINAFSKRMILPAYDFILDNPVETKDDIEKTLRLLQKLPRPYTINGFSLRVIPNTELAVKLSSLGVVAKDIKDDYTETKPTIANILVFAIPIVRLPDKIFNYFLKKVKPSCEEQKCYKNLMIIIKAILYLKRGIIHLKHMDFSVMPGKPSWIFWRLGVIRLHHALAEKNKK
ncbi:MAG: B12-binding domain-containing radical SAM protein [Proteobacteria bacterium]|nr:B12-binding domain-containing radical SAM protein [Pseudomonadota bacterium]MBU4259396.1 B12-binding domain-containing radical SAM protein [Pseudomonadota bacterium]MBU4288195.1 B12-binding domain-containing radical SAM protein [Pseudomonadota bacterium]MBU4415095.1 B12-binding domain-containing radical SAM protein [Pseudomonadota bacterium]MCG2757760.1 B12-binding domain-containing radical SAM protein [Desulfobacteraceae bacterium]